MIVYSNYSYYCLINNYFDTFIMNYHIIIQCFILTVINLCYYYLFNLHAIIVFKQSTL